MSFCLKRENARQYPETKIHPDWKEWRRNWYFAQEGSLSPHLLVPTAPAESLANSRDISSQDEALLPIIKMFAELRDSQVSGAKIAGDFVRRGNRPSTTQAPTAIEDPPGDRITNTARYAKGKDAHHATGGVV